jgi:hypothetical protein
MRVCGSDEGEYRLKRVEGCGDLAVRLKSVGSLPASGAKFAHHA